MLFMLSCIRYGVRFGLTRYMIRFAPYTPNSTKAFLKVRMLGQQCLMSFMVEDIGEP